MTAIAIAIAFVHLMQFCKLLELDYVYRNDGEDFYRRESPCLKYAQAALDEAKKTVKDITGLEVNDMTASVDPNTNSIKV